MYLRIILLIMVFVSVYIIGYSNCHNKVVSKQIEVIKYVRKENAKIISRPNALKPELLELLRSNKL